MILQVLVLFIIAGLWEVLPKKGGVTPARFMVKRAHRNETLTMSQGIPGSKISGQLRNVTSVDQLRYCFKFCFEFWLSGNHL